MPPNDRRGLNEQDGGSPQWRDARRYTDCETLPRCPPHPSVDLAPRSDQLLAEQRGLGEEFDTAPDEVNDQSQGEPQQVGHPGVVARPGRGRHL